MANILTEREWKQSHFRQFVLIPKTNYKVGTKALSVTIIWFTQANIISLLLHLSAWCWQLIMLQTRGITWYIWWYMHSKHRCSVLRQSKMAGEMANMEKKSQHNVLNPTILRLIARHEYKQDLHHRGQISRMTKLFVFCFPFWLLLCF